MPAPSRRCARSSPPSGPELLLDRQLVHDLLDTFDRARIRECLLPGCVAIDGAGEGDNAAFRRDANLHALDLAIEEVHRLDLRRDPCVGDLLADAIGRGPGLSLDLLLVARQ